jgi:hypothetical protein
VEKHGGLTNTSIRHSQRPRGGTGGQHRATRSRRVVTAEADGTKRPGRTAENMSALDVKANIVQSRTDICLWLHQWS